MQDLTYFYQPQPAHVFLQPRVILHARSAQFAVLQGENAGINLGGARTVRRGKSPRTPLCNRQNTLLILPMTGSAYRHQNAMCPGNPSLFAVRPGTACLVKLQIAINRFDFELCIGRVLIGRRVKSEDRTSGQLHPPVKRHWL